MKIAAFFDQKLLKYLLVGIINTIVGSAIMFSLYNVANLNYWISSACNYFFTGILSFFLNKYFTFGIKHWSAFMVVTFIVNIALSYIIAYGIAKPALKFLLNNCPTKILENSAMFTGMFLFTGINYLGQRLVIFKIKEENYGFN
ncbi:MAG: GtrA family protein [Treponema sp.]|nr:GtrA family protein [Treponema sp.]